MRVSRALFGCLVVASCQSIAFAQDTSADSELILGPVVPIGARERQEPIVVAQNAGPQLGPVVPLAGPTTDQLRRYSAVHRLPVAHHDLGYFAAEAASAPVPQVHLPQPSVIRHPIAAPMIAAPMIQMVHRVAPVQQPQAIHPDQVRAHLTTAIQSLQTAGMVDEANQVLAIQQRFLQNRYQDLLVAHKESQVQALQAEIASLKQSQSAASTVAQVHLQLQIVHVNHAQREELVKALRDMSRFFAPSNPPQVVNHCMIEGLHNVETQAVHALIKDLVGRQCATIVAEPSAVVLNGRTVYFACDPASSKSLVGVVGPRNRAPSQNSGTTFEICPNVAPSGEIQLTLRAEFFRPRPKFSTDREEPVFSRFNVASPFELEPGQTLAFVGPSEAMVADQPNLKYPTCDLFIVTPTVIRGPASMPVPLPAVLPVEYQISRPVIEAKN